MPLFSPPDRAFAAAISRLLYCNPFLPERIEFEREALGADFVDAGPVWNIRANLAGDRPNIVRLAERTEALAGRLRERLAAGARPTPEERTLYEDLAAYLLYYRYRDRFQELIDRALGGQPPSGRVAFYAAFERDAAHFLSVPGVPAPPPVPPVGATFRPAPSAVEGSRPPAIAGGPSTSLGARSPLLPDAPPDAAHLFACFFHIRRAFYLIYTHIVGASLPAARLRGAVWQSIFTHDMRRYRRLLYGRMGDMTALITGPTGTGKELVARAIGLSRYIPFDPKTQSFTENFADSFHALNLSALSPTLIESELFGHRRGAFTGAVQDRRGWLEACRPLGTVFLDEVGDLDAAIQVKLLRVLQTRAFQRLGDTATLRFEGKIVAATNKDLGREMAAGRLRRDFYYRLCSDVVVTPSLREQLVDAPDDLRNMVRFIADRVAGEEAEALAAEVEAWIETRLGRDYAWPGNFRELEQCVRNVLIRREYHPPRSEPPDARAALAEAAAAGTLAAEDLLRRYCTLVYAQTGNYGEAARRLGLDRRTVKSKIDAGLIEAFRAGKKS